jgi:hypothetical protein
VHASTSRSAYGYLNSRAGSGTKVYSAFDIPATATASAGIGASAASTADNKNIKGG